MWEREVRVATLALFEPLHIMLACSQLLTCFPFFFAFFPMDFSSKTETACRLPADLVGYFATPSPLWNFNLPGPCFFFLNLVSMVKRVSLQKKCQGFGIPFLFLQFCGKQSIKTINFLHIFDRNYRFGEELGEPSGFWSALVEVLFRTWRTTRFP